MSAELKLCPNCFGRRPLRTFFSATERKRKHCAACYGERGEDELRAVREAGWLEASAAVARTMQAWSPSA